MGSRAAYREAAGQVLLHPEWFTCSPAWEDMVAAIRALAEEVGK
jgi:hypothetical protein